MEVARLNGSHLPVRDMLALVSNMILGHKDRDTKEGLMACSDIARIQDAGTMEKGGLYGNVFGANLPRRRAMDRPVFKALASFGISYVQVRILKLTSHTEVASLCAGLVPCL